MAEVATPLEFVVTVVNPPANVTLGRVEAGGVNVTVVPAATGLPPESVTVATSAANAVLMAVLWPSPEVRAILAGVPGVFVSVNDVEAGPAVTLSVNCPALLFAVNVPGSATPDAFVLTVFVAVLLSNVPLCPFAPALAVNVTEKFGITTFAASLTTIAKLPNAVLMVADLGAKPFALTDAGTCTTEIMSVEVLFPVYVDNSPPPDIVTELVTLVGEVVGMFTTSSSSV